MSGPGEGGTHQTNGGLGGLLGSVPSFLNKIPMKPVYSLCTALRKSQAEKKKEVLSRKSDH